MTVFITKQIKQNKQTNTLTCAVWFSGNSRPGDVCAISSHDGGLQQTRLGLSYRHTQPVNNKRAVNNTTSLINDVASCSCLDPDGLSWFRKVTLNVLIFLFTY